MGIYKTYIFCKKSIDISDRVWYYNQVFRRTQHKTIKRKKNFKFSKKLVDKLMKMC